MSIEQRVHDVKADPSILQCKIKRLVRNVWRICVCRKAGGLMGVCSVHMIFEFNRSDEDFTDTETEWVSDDEGP
jgi:hypothetical protein